MDLKNADKLSHAAQGVLHSRSSGAYSALVVSEGAGIVAGHDVRAQLAGLRGGAILDGPVASPQDAQALLAGLWLWHDCLDESHTISQNLPSATGSFWHAIMHRREADFSNAKYWYARCRNHPALAEIGARAARAAPELGSVVDPELQRLIGGVGGGGAWDPDRFVYWVARLHRQGPGPSRDAAVRLQQIEWAALFDHCILAAAGR